MADHKALGEKKKLMEHLAYYISISEDRHDLIKL